MQDEFCTVMHCIPIMRFRLFFLLRKRDGLGNSDSELSYYL